MNTDIIIFLYLILEDYLSMGVVYSPHWKFLKSFIFTSLEVSQDWKLHKNDLQVLRFVRHNNLTL